MGEAVKPYNKETCVSGWKEFEAINHLLHKTYKDNEKIKERVLSFI